MKFAKVHSAQAELLSARIIDVEIDVSRGLYSFSIIGLGDKAIEESKDRVISAIKHSGFKSPKTKNAKIVVALAPAHIKKTGPMFDVAIAIGYLLATNEIDFDPAGKIFLGEVSLDGTLRKITGVLPIVLRAKKLGFTEIFIPLENVREAGLVNGIAIYGANNLSEIIEHLTSTLKLQPAKPTLIKNHQIENEFSFEKIRGQEHAKRALEISATGNHNIMLYGPPGTGKTMLAKSLRSIMPPLSKNKIFETTSIHSVAGILNSDYISDSPYRSPHHTSSYVSIIGGGSHMQPGEITLAHNGILFLDEFPEFDRRVIDSLRQPLEDNTISIARANSRATFPCEVLLVTAMNPCPCGYSGSTKKQCECPQFRIEQYQKKLSGPILDRIDLWVHVPEVDMKHIIKQDNVRSARDTETKILRNKILIAREKQSKRKQKKSNASLSSTELESLGTLSPENRMILAEASERLGLSVRGFYKVYKVAQTIADLDNSEKIQKEHILEALQYRQTSP